MDLLEAKILFKNLLNRVETLPDGSKQLPGVITKDELEALNIALTILSTPPSDPTLSFVGKQPVSLSPATSEPFVATPFKVAEESAKSVQSEPVESQTQATFKLNLSVLTTPSPPEDIRLCLDFGTAMSKATLVQDNDDIESEEIHVLKLGVPGDQEEISEHMLVSSVYINNDGLLWFGKAAIDRSRMHSDDGTRQRLDNIKRRLSEDGWDEQVGTRFNPTNTPVSHGDMVLAYMMYMTWAVNCCLLDLGYPLNLPRRFAMPCLSGEKGRETVHRLKKVVGEAQILADTFHDRLKDGLPMSDFLNAVTELRKEPRVYSYVAEDITEPLGVAGSIISWKTPIDMLIMVVDIGAGTSDLSLYRINFNPNTGNNTAIEIEGSSRVLTEAGNYLDRTLIELIVKKSDVTSEDSMWVNIRGALELQIRDLKESLFNDEYVFVSLMNGKEVEINLDEFLQLESVRMFGENLRANMVDILESIDSSWIDWILTNPSRKLVVALTGGGADLPMVKALVEGEIQVNDSIVPVARALSFPTWLMELDENLETDYPRIAVSLGGARRRLMQKGYTARITAGDITQTPRLDGYFTRGG